MYHCPNTYGLHCIRLIRGLVALTCITGHCIWLHPKVHPIYNNLVITMDRLQRHNDTRKLCRVTKRPNMRSWPGLSAKACFLYFQPLGLVPLHPPLHVLSHPTGEPPQDGSSHKYRPSTQGQSFQHIGPPAHTTIHEHLHLAFYRLHYLWEHINLCTCTQIVTTENMY